MNLQILQFKIKRGMFLTPEEEMLLTKSLDDQGIQSQRRFTGYKEYPESVSDQLQDI